jgi:hypothetical protein
MHTLFDFITHIKIVEYLIALSFIAGFILFLEILKPKPFHSLVENGKEDLTYIKQGGVKNLMKTVGRIVTAPFIGMAYVIALPIGFVIAIAAAALSGLATVFGGSASFGWRPVEAYLGGKRRKKGGPTGDEASEEDDDSQA